MTDYVKKTLQERLETVRRYLGSLEHDASKRREQVADDNARLVAYKAEIAEIEGTLKLLTIRPVS